MNGKIVDFEVEAGGSAGELLSRMRSAGFQASELSRAAQVLSRMREDEDCVKFLAFTANIVASGLRGCLAQLIREGYADVVITSGGSIDHDVIKSYGDYSLASFDEDDATLHAKGVNRIGNILVDNRHYELLERKLQPVFKSVYSKSKSISPNGLINAVADSLPTSRHSFLAAARKRGVFVYSPALVDSALGLQLHFFKQDFPDFVLDETGDMGAIANRVLTAKRTGALVLGGGSSKHFTLGCNLLRGGLDYSVYVSTAQEFDGSLSGAPPREAKSWGKIRGKASTALVVGEATLALPLLMAGLKKKRR